MIFACTNQFWKSMNKKDRRTIKQYIETKQGKLLYQVDMATASSSGQREKNDRLQIYA